MEQEKIPTVEQEGTPIVTEAGILVDYTADDFRKFCADKNMGMLRSYENYFTILFERCTLTKNELRDKINAGQLSMQEERVKNTMNGMYSKLMKLEEKIFILREIIKERLATNKE